MKPQETPTFLDQPDSSVWEVKFGLKLPKNLRTYECLWAARLWLAYKSERRHFCKPASLEADLAEWGREYTADQFPGLVQRSMSRSWQRIRPPTKPGGQP